MAAIDELIQQIQDPILRERIRTEVEDLSKQKKFGLVFENHLAECVPLYDSPIKVGALVTTKIKSNGRFYFVQEIKNDRAVLIERTTKDICEFPLKALVVVADIGESIYPYLRFVDSVSHSPDDDLWHALIESDNYHALQLLEYLYSGKVDCIYIDPPYNSGARDWKYNNDYVDESDSYRHSKWLSMMEKRLRIAKRLLNPQKSVLIVTIDEKEYLRLGLLLEEIFQNGKIQMVSSVINPAGAGRRAEFARTDEYIFFVRIGELAILSESREMENVPVIWDTLRRSSLANARGRHGKGACGPNQFFPIYVDVETGRIKEIGDPIPETMDRHAVGSRLGCSTVFPVRPDGTEMNWGITPEVARERLAKGYLRAGKRTPGAPQEYVISYVTGGNIEDIESGKAVISGYEEDGSVIAYYPKGRDKMPTTNWNRPTHDAQRYGTNLLSEFIGNRFPYPKSLYAVEDCLRLTIGDNPNALILDFFAGSGTTLHAVNLLNKVDGGKRRCIMVTNNEVSPAEEKRLSERGFFLATRSGNAWALPDM